MGVCCICAMLKSQRQNAESPTTLGRVNNALQQHRDQQAQERAKLAKHRRKCLRSSDKYIGIFMDGMDQKKTVLPHFVRVPKDVKEETFVQMHLVGCLVYHGQLKAKVFFTYPNVHSDPNLSVTVIHNVLSSMKGSLPPIMYVQLDNTARENKNQAVLAYMCMLVEKGVFEKIKVGFLLVGHTHDQIDQMFSTFSKRLGRIDAFTLLRMMDIVKDSYTPTPDVCHLKETFDFKAFIQGQNREEICIKKLNDLSFQHQFLIKRDIHGKVCLYGKQYSTSPEWMPRNGLQFLTFVPDHEMHASVQDPLVLENEVKQAHAQRREINYERCLNEKRALIEKAKQYAKDEDVGPWWDSFFEDQASILHRFKCGLTLLMGTFEWPIQSCLLEANNDNARVQIQPLADIHGREMYLGARRSRQRQAELLAIWEGSIQDIKVGSMVATLSMEDPYGHPFWIAKVMEIHGAHDGKGPSDIVVQWYKTTHTNPLRGKYLPEIVTTKQKNGRKKGKRKTPRLDVLDLQKVDILAYDFELTTSGHLRKRTIEILCQKVPCYAIHLADGSSSQMTRSQMERSLGLHKDEENAVVDSLEEDGSSTSSSSDDIDDEGIGVDTDEDAIIGKN